MIRIHFFVLVALATSGSWLSAQSSSPSWWSNGNPPAVDSSIQNADNNSVANIGQAKWMAKRALEALEEVLPVSADAIRNSMVGNKTVGELLAVPVPADAAWYEQQKAPLLIGQLKALSAPFYDELNLVAPFWLDSEDPTYPGQLQLNSTKHAGTHRPWGVETGAENNYGIANIGQLKAVFALRFRESADGDDVSDLWEEYMINTVPALTSRTQITNDSDFDGDGILDIDEARFGFDPTIDDMALPELRISHSYDFERLDITTFYGTNSIDYGYDSNGNIESVTSN